MNILLPRLFLAQGTADLGSAEESCSEAKRSQRRRPGAKRRAKPQIGALSGAPKERSGSIWVRWRWHAVPFRKAMVSEHDVVVV